MVKEVDSLNETYIKMPEFTDYSVPVLRSAQACEMLLLVLLQDKEDKKIDEIKGSIDILADEIKKLSGQIEGYQSLVERQLKLAKLIVLLGESAWEKMDESSKFFLISARVMYSSLVRMKSKIKRMADWLIRQSRKSFGC